MKCKCGHDKEEHYAYNGKDLIPWKCSNDENGECKCMNFKKRDLINRLVNPIDEHFFNNEKDKTE